MRKERYQLDKEKIREKLREVSLGELITGTGSPCFEADFKKKPTLADIGVLADVKTGTWHHYLYHDVKADRAVCERVAAVLGCEVHEVLSDRDELIYLRAAAVRLADWRRESVTRM